MKMDFKGDALHVDYIDRGSGETIIILQGWGTTANLYESLVRSLETHARVIVPNFPGFGASTEPSFAYDTADYADFVVAFLQKLNISTASLVGHSHGGRVCIELASRKELPFVLKKLVLMDSAGIPAKKTFSQKARIRVFKMLKALVKWKPVHTLFPEALPALQKAFGSADYASSSVLMRQSMVKLINADLSPRLADIAVPTLLFWGEKDEATPLSHAKIMEKSIPDAGLVTVPGGGHFSFVDDPRFAGRVLASFFEF